MTAWQRRSVTGPSSREFGPNSAFTKELFSGNSGAYYRDATEAGITAFAKANGGKIPDGRSYTRFNHKDYDGSTGLDGFKDGRVEMSDVIGTFTQGIDIKRVGNMLHFTGRNSMSLESFSGNNILKHNLVVNPSSGPLATKQQIFRWTRPVPIQY